MQDKAFLQAVDYVIIVIMLVIPLGIGIFFAVRDAKRMTRDEYLLGGRHMSMLPVAFSLFVTFQSAISLIGVPDEVYHYGPMYFIFYFGDSLSFGIAAVTLVPLMYPLQLTSVYEYLETRFESKLVRYFSTVTGMLQTYFYMVVALLAPGLALEAAVGVPLWMSVAIVGVTGTVYTSLGGIKSVVWTDAFQFIIIFVGVFAIIIKSVQEVGGIDKVWSTVSQGERANFDVIGPDPRIRHTWLGALLGSSFNWMTNLFAQSSVMRVASLRSLRSARLSMLVNIPLNIFFGCTVLVLGWCMYAYLNHIRCDPFKSGLVTNSNQMTPYFVMHALYDLPGIAGLYMAAMFSGALSTVSSGINSLAANTVEDFLKRPLQSVSEKTATSITKLIVLVFGGAIIGTAYLAKALEGPVTQMATSVIGAFGSSVLGMFLLGGCITWTNKYGAIAGGVTSLIINVWIVIGSILHGAQRPTLTPVPTDMCSANTSVPLDGDFHQNTTDVFARLDESGIQYGANFLYDISYEWISVIGVMVCFTTGLIVSRITRKPELICKDPKLLFPFLRRFWNLKDTGAYHIDEMDTREDDLDVGLKDKDDDVIVKDKNGAQEHLLLTSKM